MEVVEGVEEEEWFLSTEADWQAVPLSASPRVAVILRVRVGVHVSAVDQHGVVDQRRVVEALDVELGSGLRRGVDRDTGREGETERIRDECDSLCQ